MIHLKMLNKRENQVRQTFPSFINLFSGLLKHEFEMTNGSAVCVCPKSYSLLNRDSDEKKTGLKGVSNRNQSVTHQKLLDVIYESKLTTASEVRFKMNKKTTKMEMIEVKKNAINPVFTKMRLCEDSVTVSPLTRCSKTSKQELV